MSVTILECMYIESHICMCMDIYLHIHTLKKSYSLFLTSEEENDINNSSYIKLAVVTHGSICGGHATFI